MSGSPWIDKSSETGPGMILPLILVVSLVLLLTALFIIFAPRLAGIT